MNGKLLAEGKISTLSQKLFGNSPYTIELGVAGHPVNGAGLPEEIVKGIDGVSSVKDEKGKMLIECSRDVTPEISKKIIDAGYYITSLSKKEYGLDDIYYHYFEGGTKNE